MNSIFMTLNSEFSGVFFYITTELSANHFRESVTTNEARSAVCSQLSRSSQACDRNNHAALTFGVARTYVEGIAN